MRRWLICREIEKAVKLWNCSTRPFNQRVMLCTKNGVNKISEFEPEQKKQRNMPTDNVVLRFAKLTDNAYAPTRGSKEAAGYDLYSAYDCTIQRGGKAIVKTDIQISLPDGCYGRVAPRSGLAAKYSIDVGAGVIDKDYRGNVQVIMFNFGENDFEVKKGERIAQLICERIYIPEIVEESKLDDTDRGDGGFGSTGRT